MSPHRFVAGKLYSALYRSNRYLVEVTSRTDDTVTFQMIKSTAADGIPNTASGGAQVSRLTHSNGIECGYMVVRWRAHHQSRAARIQILATNKVDL